MNSEFPPRVYMESELTIVYLSSPRFSALEFEFIVILLASWWLLSQFSMASRSFLSFFGMFLGSSPV